ncbi:MAG: hypothetical protein E5Y15_14895 [Mesorhizobium sp.]|nr:MAG: hypothetical protein E5Y15_14895 [Mesorhizobium sp.]
MKPFFVLAISTHLSIVSALPVSSQTHCEGDTRQEHRVGNFNFITNSSVEDVGTRRRYVSCVENLDRGSDLLVHWLIPGPYKQYVPSSNAVSTPRLRDDINTRPVPGCLQYGSLGEMTTAEFLGTVEDEERNRSGDCTAQAAAVSEAKVVPSGLPPEGYADEVHVFFPSDVSNPHETMLELFGKVGIQVDGAAYSSFFSYGVRQLEGRAEGRVEDVRVEPYFPEASEQFASSFIKSNGSMIQALSSDGEISFDITGVKENAWRTVEAYYQFVDMGNNVVARIPMPLLQDVEK